MVSRSLLSAVVVVLVLVLVADVGGQFVIPGHSASAVVSGGVLTILGGVFAASRGPKPDLPDPPEDDGPPTVPPATPPPGRHHRREGSNP